MLGLARVIHPDLLTPLVMIRAVREELDRGNVHVGQMYRLDMNGLDRVAEAVLGNLPMHLPVRHERMARAGL